MFAADGQVNVHGPHFDRTLMSDSTAVQAGLGCSCLPKQAAELINASPAIRLSGVAHSTRAISKGQRLYRSGDVLRAIYLVLDGAVKTVTISVGGCERIIGFHLPGEMIGLDGLGEFRHRCAAIALTDRTCVLHVSIDQFMQTALGPKAMREWTLRIIGNSMRNDIEHLEMIGRRHAVGRIALFVCELIQRSHQLVESGARMTLPMGREDIASFLDLAPETVSRGFRRLQTLGVIEVNHRDVEVRNAKKLQTFALCHEPRMRRRGFASEQAG